MGEIRYGVCDGVLREQRQFASFDSDNGGVIIERKR